MRGLALLRRVATPIVAAATFVGAAAAAVSLHAGAPAFRRAAAQIANDALAGRFAGKIVVGDVEVLSVGRRGIVRARWVTVYDPDGTVVLSAKDVDAEIDLATLVRSRAGVIDVGRVHVGEVDALLDAAADGRPRVARAFAKPNAAAEAPPPAPGEPRPATIEVRVREAEIERARVHGVAVAPGPPIDGRVAAIRASFALEHGRSRVVLDHAEVDLDAPRAATQRAPVHTTASATLEVGGGDPLRATAKLDGACAAVRFTADAKLEGDDLDATLDVPRTEPTALASAFDDLPLHEAASVHARARGTLPQLAVEAHAAAASANVDATGTVDLRAGRAFALDVVATKIDARAFGARASTELGGKGHVAGTLGADGPKATFHVTTEPGTAAGQPVPPATVDGRLEGGRVEATLSSSESGIAASGNATYDLGTKIAVFDVGARSSSLAAIARLPTRPAGAATMRARGQVDVGAGTVTASVDASGAGLALEGFSAASLDAHGDVTGPLAAPNTVVRFRGTDLRVQAKDKEPLVYPVASGSARVVLAPAPRIEDAEVTLRERGARQGVTLSARSVSLAGGVVDVRGATVQGLGETMQIDLAGGGGRWNVRAKSDRLDLRQAARLTGIAQLKMAPPGTHAAVDIDVVDAPDGPRGHLDVVVRADKTLGEGDVVAEAHATIERGQLTGTARLAADGLGQVEITRADLALPSRMDGASLARTTGTIDLRGVVDLAQGAALFGGERVERVAGLASFEARIERADPTALPAVRGTVRTTGLEVVLATPPAEGGPPPDATSTTFTGVDLSAHVAWDGKSEDAELALLSWDAHGVLGSAAAKARLPLADWATGAKKLDLDAVSALEVAAAADMPSRNLADVPSFLRGGLGLRGGLDANVRVRGTLGQPRAVLSVHGDGLGVTHGSDKNAALEPVDATLEARWNGEHAALTFGLTERPAPPKPKRRDHEREREDAAPGRTSASRGPRPAAYVHGLVLATVKMEDVLRGKTTGPIPWKAGGQVELQNVSLGALPLPGRFGGIVSGRAQVQELNAAGASFDAKLHVDDLAANGASIDDVDLTVAARDKKLDATIDGTDTTTSTGGKALLKVASESLRIEGTDVTWDPKGATRLDYAVSHLRLALAAPLVRRSVSELDGTIDGFGNVTVDATSQTFEGGLVLSDGTLYVNAIGEEISGLAARLQFEKSGAWRIDEATGKMGTGEFVAQASGHMKGLSFVDADATLTASKGGIPISSQAATFAEAVGQVKLTAKESADGRTIEATVDVPTATVGLPDRSPQQLQRLDADPTVTVGFRRKTGALDTSVVKKTRGRSGTPAPAAQPATVSATSAQITVTLGKEVHLQGRGIDVSLGGKTLVQLADQLQVTGQIDLRGGSIEVHGRRFTVDRGTVSFADGADPSNPTVIAAAYWDAPDGTKVWVEFAGPIKTGKLTLRSEPPFSKSEILSVLLFGRPDPNMAAASSDPSSGDASGATAIGTGIVADDLNRVLSDIDDNLDIETDTLEGNRTRTKLGHTFFDRRLKVQIGYAPGQDYREPDTTFLFLNWQFVPKWSLVATRGDRGTSILDVLFQHRY